MASRYYGGGYGLVPQALGDVNENIYRMLGDYRKSKEDERAHNLAMQGLDIAGEKQKTEGLSTLGTLGLRKQQNEAQKAYQEGMLGLQGKAQAFSEQKWADEAPMRAQQVETERARAAAAAASAGAAGALRQQRQYELQQSQRLQAFMDREMTAEQAAKEAGWGPSEVEFAKAIGGDAPMPGKAWAQIAQGMTPKMKVAMQLTKIGDKQQELYAKMVDPKTTDEEAAELESEYVQLTNSMRFMSGLLEGKEMSASDKQKLIATAYATWEGSPQLQQQYPDPNEFAKTTIATAEAAQQDPRSIPDLVNMNRDSIAFTRQTTQVGAALSNLASKFGDKAAQETQQQIAGKSPEKALEILKNRYTYYEHGGNKTVQPTDGEKPSAEYQSHADVLRSGENLFDEGGFGSSYDNPTTSNSPAFSNGLNKLVDTFTPKGTLLGNNMGDAYRMAGLENIRENAIPAPPSLAPGNIEAFNQPRQVGNFGDVTDALEQNMRDRYRATKPPGGIGLLGGDYSGMNPMPRVKDAMNQLPQRELSPIEKEAVMTELRRQQEERYRAVAPKRPISATPIPDYSVLHQYLGK